MGQCFVNAKLNLKEQECTHFKYTKTAFQQNFSSVVYRVNKQVMKFTTESVLFFYRKQRSEYS